MPTRYAVRFVILDEVAMTISRNKNGVIRSFKGPRSANTWASSHLGNWSVLEQVLWEGAMPPGQWCTQQLH